MTRSMGPVGGRPADGEPPALWIDEGRFADNPYLGLGPRIHGFASDEAPTPVDREQGPEDRRRARMGLTLLLGPVLLSVIADLFALLPVDRGLAILGLVTLAALIWGLASSLRR